MKKMFYTLVVLIATGGVLLWARRPVPSPASRLTETPAAVVTSPAEPAAPAAPPQVEPKQAPPEEASAPAKSAPSQPTPPAGEAAASVLSVDQAVAALADTRTPYIHKEALRKQLVKAGKLDEAITALENRIAANPNSPGDVAALGHAYLAKAGVTEDYTERASLGMKIDKTFDQALKLDPENWEARFNKANSMSYWPSYLGKDKEVVEQLLALIQQQETQAPEPQFAQTYTKLGEQYQKLGRNDYAQQIWQRGATQFPDNQTLQKLSTRAAQP